jgi:hypothetical protein
MTGHDRPILNEQGSLGPTNVSEEVRTIWAHAEHCFACWSLLTRDDEIRRRLALLRETEPRFDVLEQVMRRIDEGA